MTSVRAAPFTPTLPNLPHRLPSVFLHQRHSGSRFPDAAAASTLSSRHRGARGVHPLLASRRGNSVEEEEDEDNGWTDEEADDDDDGEEPAMPFQEMRQWLRNKPAGFGEGKSYDTRLEDELWEEMERSKNAQLANLEKLKKSDGISNKKQSSPQKAPDEVPYGTRVRVWNLPRKKNIHKDLQRAFKGFPGLVSISPAVIGNEKTREPICKGFAFVNLASEEAANRFVQVYSRKSLCFGKVEKQIACVVMHGTRESSEPNHDSEEKMIDIEVVHESEAGSILPKEKKDRLSTHLEESDKGPEHVNHLKNGNEMKGKVLDPNYNASPVQKQPKSTPSHKKPAKRYLVKASKPTLPGSVARLKIKEKTILTGVFSKYSKKVSADT